MRERFTANGTTSIGFVTGWPPGKEFSFAIQGESMAGLPQLKQQFAGFRYQGVVRVQTHSPRVLLVKVEYPQSIIHYSHTATTL